MDRFIPVEHARALLATESLKRRLEESLIGNRVIGMTTFPSEVVGIEYPSTKFPYPIAAAGFWQCTMRNNGSGDRWSLGISHFIPWSRLYPMFRNHFADLDVQVDHPHAQLLRDNTSQAARQGRKFTPGRRVTVSHLRAVFVRPMAAPEQSVWVNAELRFDPHPDQHSEAPLVLACNVDPFDFGQHLGRGTGKCYLLSDPDLSEKPTFYIQIMNEGWVAVARLEEVDRHAGEATFVLDEAVEAYQPHLVSQVQASLRLS